MRTLNVGGRVLPFSSFVVGISILFSCTTLGRLPQCYKFPSGFRGWVSISYGVGSATHPKDHRGCVVFDFTGVTHIDTRLSPPVGWAEDRYWESGPAGYNLHFDIEPKETERGVRDRYFEFFGETAREWVFIGTQKDLESIPNPNPSQKGIRNRRL
jgi:hypothetical protein